MKIFIVLVILFITELSVAGEEKKLPSKLENYLHLFYRMNTPKPTRFANKFPGPLLYPRFTDLSGSLWLSGNKSFLSKLEEDIKNYNSSKVKFSDI